MEIGIYQLKKMLKQSDFSLFDDIKLLVRQKLKVQHLEFNPRSENYREDDLHEKAMRAAERKKRFEDLKKGNKIKKGIKKEELTKIYKELFSIMDENDDGVLTPDEFRNFMTANYELHGVKHDS